MENKSNQKPDLSGFIILVFAFILIFGIISLTLNRLGAVDEFWYLLSYSLVTVLMIYFHSKLF